MEKDYEQEFKEFMGEVLEELSLVKNDAEEVGKADGIQKVIEKLENKLATL